MKLLNKTRETIIHNDIRFVNELQQIKGLIGEKTPRPLILKTRFGIHTFFLTFPIDVLILSKEQQVVTFKENLKPYRFFFWNPRYDTVIELPPGTIKQSKTKRGDMLQYTS